MKATSLILWAAAAMAYLAPSHLFAATGAYWRHEEGPVGSIVPDGPDTVLDSSGAGNHMQTFSSAFAPFTAATYVSEVSPLPLRSGLPNTLALDFGPNPVEGTEDGADPGNGNGVNDDNYTAGKPIQNQLFTAQTIELAFNMHSVGNGAWQAVFGKDGKPLGDAPGEDDRPVPAFKVLIRNDAFPDDVPNQIFVEWVDGDGTLASDIHFLSSGFTTVPGQWYHLAITRTATDAELWIAGETGPYELVDAISGADFAGPDGRIEVEEPASYSIGRGMFNNGVTDWSNAIVDEVRISDTALTPDQFLFVAGDAPVEDADFDGDGDVDGQDFLTWQRGLGQTGTGTLTTGDANDDNDVDGADLAIWRQQFGPGAPVTAIPEPASAGLCLVSLATALILSRSRGTRRAA
jgi:hypothetical protein